VDSESLSAVLIFCKTRHVSQLANIHTAVSTNQIYNRNVKTVNSMSVTNVMIACRTQLFHNLYTVLVFTHKVPYTLLCHSKSGGTDITAGLYVYREISCISR
jgi:succinyl-CoA synthetase beta subunit